MLAAFGTPMSVVTVVEQGRKVGIDLHEGAAAGAPIATVGPSLRHKLFATKGTCSRATSACGDLDNRAVNEHPDLRLARRDLACGVWRAALNGEPRAHAGLTA